MKAIEGQKGYFIAENGEVFSEKTNTFLKQHLNNNNGRGYYTVTIGYGRKGQKKHYVHRLVAQTFLPNPDMKRQVNHKDGNRLNNHVDNLEWCTHIENMIHGTKELGTKQAPYKCFQYDLNNNLIAIYSTMRDAKNEIGADKGALRRIRLGLQKTHLNYYWQFKRAI